MSDREVDWQAVTEGLVSIFWCSNSVRGKDENTPFSDVYSEFLDKHAGIHPMNRATAIMASYLIFVYPRERQLKELPLDRIRDEVMPKFNWNTKPQCNTWTFLRRLRNALAHGDWHFDKMNIIFESKKEGWVATIDIREFGHFVGTFYTTVLENKSPPEQSALMSP
jgi:hypothetical protein